MVLAPWTGRALYDVFFYVDPALVELATAHRAPCAWMPRPPSEEMLPSRASRRHSATSPRCTCHEGADRIVAGAGCTVLHTVGAAALVETGARARGWVEAAAIMPSTAVPKPRQDLAADIRRRMSPPPDWTLLQKALDGEASLGRRRRPVRGGELCWLRTAQKTVEHVVRFFAMSGPQDDRYAVLLTPHVPALGALNAGWADARTVALGSRLPEALLVPVFPLQVSVRLVLEDPGWTAPDQAARP